MKSKSKMTKGFVWSMLPLSLVMLSLKPGGAQAATFVVNSTADVVDAAPGNGACATAAGVCTLRAAIMEANALSGADIITLPAGTYSLTIPGVNEDLNATGDLDINSDLTITGAGANMTIIDAGGIDRVLEIRPGSATNVRISGLTVTGGKTLSTQPGGGSGGGIRNGGTLTLTSVKVSANTADLFGGGIYNDGGTLTVNGSMVSGNVVTINGFAGGGGIFSIGIGRTVTLNSSTVNGNTAVGVSFGAGGGIWMYHGTLILNNSTVSGNTAKYGGGINTSNNSIILNLSNSTISGNTGNNGGGGIRTGENAHTTFKNTIVAGNLGGGDCQISPTSNVVNSLGHNLDSDGTCRLIKPTDLPNRQQPLLGPLTNNGGSTQTHALLPGSPAIDKGSDCLTVDQRGVPRPQPPGGECDIGAYEVGAAPPNRPPLSNAGPDQTVEATGSSGASVTLNGSGSSDPDSNPLTYNWTGPFGTLSGVSHTVTLPLGTHTVTLKVSDGQATATDTINITVRDTTPPDTIINSAVDGNGAAVAKGGSTLSGSITFTFVGTDVVGVAGFQCSRDGSGFAPCTSPAGHSALAIGNHSFQVRALDAAGNVDASPASFTWTVITPAQAIQNLITTVNNMGLAGGVATSLTAPLSNINTNNKAAACAKLNAFINQVNAKAQNGQLTPAQASQLLTAADAIKASLGC